jgi:hypothetical protein
MCQMRVVVDENGKETMVMENATRLTVVGDAIEVEAFFETSQRIESAFVQAIDFLEGKVVLTRKMA